MPTVADIAALLNVPVSGDTSRQVSGIATLTDAGPTDVSFLSSGEYLEQFAATRATAVIVDRSVRLPAEAKSGGNGDGGKSAPALMLVDDSDLAVALVLPLFAPPIQMPPVGIDPAARVAPSATLGEGARVGPFVQIGERTRIGRNTFVHAGAFVGDDVTIGDDCQIFPNVSVRERVTIGNRVILNSGCVIGTDGFGYKWDPKRKQHVKIPHIGTVVIEDDVEIGSCTCVDRAKFAATRVGRGTKLDNQVQIGHNAVLGPHCIFAGQVGIAGSVTLGAGVVIGGQTAIVEHLNIADGARIASCSAVYRDVEAGASVSGIPADEHNGTLRSQVAFRKLPDLIKKVRELEREIKQLRSMQKS
ncbi:MAG: UDP-3-O-(3-hydroxymyristoyl)glucosamine N-acyltransferase [Anaerolineae bacterium]|nr:UDP-3-O-(3-hydroxymyristoyl)glucosamine N-acyltransferase [Phycisphaerae bacterium]